MQKEDHTINMNKVTEELKITMKELREMGLTFSGIGKTLGLSESTVQYHLNPKYRKETIARSIKNQKSRDKKEYLKNYMKERYNNDEEFKERVKKDNRENWRKKHGKSNNIS